jgi:chaperonin GroES
MSVRPLHDRIIVKRLEEKRKTASGIVIPDTAAEKPDQGEVLAKEEKAPAPPPGGGMDY